MRKAKFYIGQIIHHRLFNYRGIIFDVDYQFLGGDEWYEKVARSQPSKNQPWYHVLVDNAKHRTYVAEINLEISDNASPIDNPLLDMYFSREETGKYLRNVSKN